MFEGTDRIFEKPPLAVDVRRKLRRTAPDCHSMNMAVVIPFNLLAFVVGDFDFNRMFGAVVILIALQELTNTGGLELQGHIGKNLVILSSKAWRIIKRFSTSTVAKATLFVRSQTTIISITRNSLKTRNVNRQSDDSAGNCGPDSGNRFKDFSIDFDFFQGFEHSA